MLAKKLLVASVITALLGGCGGTPIQPALSEGDYGSDQVAPADDYGSDYGSDTGSDTGSYDPTTDPTAGDDIATEPDEPTDTPDAADGYTLKGFIADAAGKAIVGATVTIGAQTVVTDSAGKYEITEIAPATKIYVSVTKSGYDSLTNKEVAFTEATPVVTQDFKLALKSSTDTDTDTDADEAGLSHKVTFASKNFKAVHAMVVSENNVFVLGTLDGLILDSTAIVTFNAEDGVALNTFKKISFFSSLPKNVTRLKLEGDEVVASNGEEAFSFSLTGAFVKKASGSLPALITEVTDSDRSITYKLNGSNKVDITKSGTKKTFKLDNVSYAKAIGLDSDGNLIVLDSSNKVVHQFAYED